MAQSFWECVKTEIWPSESTQKKNMLGMKAHAFNPSAEQTKTRSPGVHWPASLAFYGSSRPIRGPVSPNKINASEKNSQRYFSRLNPPVCLFTHTHIESDQKHHAFLLFGMTIRAQEERGWGCLGLDIEVLLGKPSLYDSLLLGPQSDSGVRPHAMKTDSTCVYFIPSSMDCL